jgi:predicted Zn-dependent protease
MELKILSKNIKLLIMLCIGGLGFGFFGCAPVTSTTSPIPDLGRSMQIGEDETSPAKQSPRALASLQLTEQGRQFIESGDPDDAIRMLEQALNLDPANGQNYYYLSEAWLMKGNISQAAEFNRLAAIYLGDDDKWLYQVIQQRERIKRSSR